MQKKKGLKGGKKRKASVCPPSAEFLKLSQQMHLFEFFVYLRDFLFHFLFSGKIFPGWMTSRNDAVGLQEKRSKR